MPTPNKYPREFREKAVRMVAEIDAPDAIKRVSEKLGVNRENRSWPGLFGQVLAILKW